MGLAARFIALVFGLTLVFSGCSSEAPEMLIDEETLVELLSEFHVADSRMLLDGSSPETLRQDILARFNVSESEYDETILYLSEHPEELAAIYGRIVDRIVESSE